ncbi:hypothetical protein ACEUZ9_000316 [Paracoccus litorisediminis]|uniref:hypothetical protein n=1 Tax=Paracoccus litorisediminis TaxID=2006130 RepID=UPI00372ECD66
MGNLVTNRINFSRRDEVSGVDAFRDVIAAVTVEPDFTIVTVLRREKEGHRVHAELDFRVISAEPEDLLGVRIDRDFEKALAIVGSNNDYVALWNERRGQNQADMPPEMQRTRYSVLAGARLAGFTSQEMLRYGDAHFPEAMEMARRAILAYEATGSFDQVTWRSKNWGSRAHGEDVAIWMEGGNLVVKFDTVNLAPIGWIKTMAEILPDFAFHGAAYDADTDYSVFFVSEEEGQMSWSESDDPEDVFKARAQIAGMSVEDLKAEQALLNGDDEDDDFDP